ncbi:MAG: nickel-dependent hydrogenase large subunit, partial [Acidithiobacillus sp.]|uniref:nickel-dependent hydrogenase large subunit n=1 Tax=Acidithiobacillus sp. TaxID=1872118 RepID=UPI00355F09A6
DVLSALQADPAKTAALAQSLSDYPRSSPGYFAEVKDKFARFAASGQLGIFANGYWGNPAYKLPPEANLMALAHYLDALAWQREVAKLHAVFGGKNPHPNFVVGGVPTAISVSPAALHDGAAAGVGATAVNMTGLEIVQNVIREIRRFVDQVYLPDTLAIAGFYKDWFGKGEGVGNFLTYGEFPSMGINDLDGLMIPRGIILNRDLSTLHPLELTAPDQIQEFVAHSWYSYTVGKDQGLHPFAGQTHLDYTGPQPPYAHLDSAASYSWIKSPRWKGKAMEVGPLARMLVLYASGNQEARTLVDSSLRKLDLPVEALFSTMGRTAARTLESKIIADAMQGWYDQLMANIRAGKLETFNPALWEPSSWPAEARGVGFMEAPRGALAHWLVIKDGVIDNYQAVVPSTWNAGPRDAAGQDGPYEAALQGTELPDPAQPLEILRTIHSFDPCIACAVHLVDPAGEELLQVKIC